MLTGGSGTDARRLRGDCPPEQAIDFPSALGRASGKPVPDARACALVPVPDARRRALVPVPDARKSPRHLLEMPGTFALAVVLTD